MEITIVFCYQNCSDLCTVRKKNCSSDGEKNLKFEAEGFRTICSNSERSEQFFVTECFLTCSWRFLRYDKLEQLQ